MFRYLVKQGRRGDDHDSEKAGGVSEIEKKQQARIYHLEQENQELVSYLE